MQITESNPSLEALGRIMLKRGAHNDRDEGVCLLEAVAWFAGEPHSDSPTCVDRALAAFGRALNDRLRDDERQLLRPLIPKLVGTAGPRELTQKRAYFLVDHHVRDIVPMMLRELKHKPQPEIAAKIEALAPIVDRKSAAAARDLARKVRDHLRSYAAYAYAAAVAADAAVGDARKRIVERSIAVFEQAIQIQA